MTRTDDDVKRRGELLKRKGAGVTNLGAARQVVGRLFVGGLSAGFMARRRSGDERDRKRSSIVIGFNTVPVIHVVCWSIVALVAHILADEMLGP